MWSGGAGAGQSSMPPAWGDVSLRDLLVASHDLEARDVELQRAMAALLGIVPPTADSRITVPEGIPPFSEPADLEERHLLGRVEGRASDSPLVYPVEVNSSRAVEESRTPAWAESVPLEPDAARRSEPPPEPLVDPRRRGPILAAAAAANAFEGALDVEAVIAELVAGRPLNHIPRRRLATVRGGVLLLLDTGDGMAAFAHDAMQLARDLARVTRLTRATFNGSPLRGVKLGTTDVQTAWRPPAPGTTLVVFSDLGISRQSLSSDAASPAEWQAFGLACQAAGIEVRTLVPYDSVRWPSSLIRLLRPVRYDRATSVRDFMRQPPHAVLEHQASEPNNDGQLFGAARRVVDLATSLSLAVRIGAPLLRAMRHALHPRESAGLEAELRASSLVAFASDTALTLRDDVRDLLRQRLAANPNQLERAWLVTKAFHPFLPPAVALEERATWLALSGAPTSVLERELGSAVKAVEANPDRASGLAHWASRALARLPAEVRATESAAALRLNAAIQGQAASLLEGVEFAGALAESARRLPKEIVRFEWRSDGLSFVHPQDKNGEFLLVPQTRPPVLEVRAGPTWRRVVEATPGIRLHVPEVTDEIHLRAVDGTEWRVRRAVQAAFSSRELPSIPAVVAFLELENFVGGEDAARFWRHVDRLESSRRVGARGVVVRFYDHDDALLTLLRRTAINFGENPTRHARIGVAGAPTAAVVRDDADVLLLRRARSLARRALPGEVLVDGTFVSAIAARNDVLWRMVHDHSQQRQPAAPAYALALRSHGETTIPVESWRGPIEIVHAPMDAEFAGRLAEELAYLGFAARSGRSFTSRSRALSIPQLVVCSEWAPPDDSFGIDESPDAGDAHEATFSVLRDDRIFERRAGTTEDRRHRLLSRVVGDFRAGAEFTVGVRALVRRVTRLQAEPDPEQIAAWLHIAFRGGTAGWMMDVPRQVAERLAVDMRLNRPDWKVTTGDDRLGHAVYSTSGPVVVVAVVGTEDARGSFEDEVWRLREQARGGPVYAFVVKCGLDTSSESAVFWSDVKLIGSFEIKTRVKDGSSSVPSRTRLLRLREKISRSIRTIVHPNAESLGPRLPPRPSGIPEELADVVDELLREIGYELPNEEPVASAIAMTNATGFGMDDCEALSAFVERDVLRFSGLVHLSGDQSPDHIYAGRKIRVVVEGRATSFEDEDGSRQWRLEGYELVDVRTEYD